MATYESGYDPKYGYNQNAFANKTIPLKVLGVANKALASGIGLVSEAIHDHKDKKQTATGSTPKTDEKDEKPISDETHLPVETDSDVDRDECDWDLDDATPELGEHLSASTLDTMNVKPPTYEEAAGSKLPFPVVLPQRRPGTKTRGFVRAYAPALENCGIDQKMFLAFLKDLHTHAQANPIFQVTMVAASIASCAPEPIVFLTANAIQIAAGVGQEVQERYRLNKFLDQVNKDVFMPRGLYALVAKYKPGEADKAEAESVTVDIGASALAKFGSHQISGSEETPSEEDPSKMAAMKEKMKQLRVASGEAHESEMPMTCATLVFPGLDAVQDARYGKDPVMKKAPAKELQDKSRNASKFVGNYFDRRAQAIYATANPNSTLTKQVGDIAPQFRSQYADPNNQTNKHFITLITGGKVKAEPLGAKRRWEKAQRKAAERQTKGLKDKPKKRFLQEDVLYLTVVNLPSPEELEAAKVRIEEEKAKKEQKKRAALHTTDDTHKA